MVQENLRFEIAYYSGTGCTAMVADCLLDTLMQKACMGNMQFISEKATSPGEHDILFLLFPVHSFNAPEAVYRWIDSINKVDRTPAVVLAVSGGGDIVPNAAGSFSSIKRLEARGYTVVYDKIIVMPSNFVVATNELLAVRLLEVLPARLDAVVDEVLSGAVLRPRRRLVDRIVSRLGEAEKPMTASFGKAIQVSESCINCEWCCNHCPAGNIFIKEDKPVFKDKCHLCLSCLYGCPNNSLIAGKMKFVLIKEGFDLSRLKRRIPLNEPVDVEKLAKGYLWSGVRKYLLE